MKKISLIIILFLIYSSCIKIYAQEQATVDSLENVLHKHKKQDTVRVNLLNKIAYNIRRKDAKKSLKYAKEAEELATKIGFVKGEAESQRQIGIYYWLQADYPKALEYYQKSLNIYEELGDKIGISKCYDNIGIIYRSQGGYSKALEYFQKSLKINKELGDKKEISFSINNIGTIYWYQGNYTKALEYFQKSLKIREEIGDKIGVASNYNNIALIYWYQSDYPKALEYFKKSLKMTEEGGNKSGTARCLNNIGGVYNKQGDYPKALEYYQKSLKIDEELEDKSGMSGCLNNIGGIYYSQGENSKALEYYKKSLKISEALGDESGTASCLNNIGSIYDNQGDYSEALKYFQKSLIIRKEIGDKSGVSLCYNSLGAIYNNQGDYPKALEYFQKSLKISAETGDKSMETRNYLGLGSLYFNQNRVREAYGYAKKAYIIATEIGSGDLIKESSEMLAQSSEQLGLYKEAYKYHVIFKTMNDSLYNEKNTKKMAGIEYKYKYEKEKEVIELEQQKKDVVQAEEAKRQKNLRNSFIVGFILTLLLAIVVFRSFLQKRKANVILVEQKEEIEAQAEELSTTNEKLKELDEFKTRMTSMIVHDLKNPLNTIVNIDSEKATKDQFKNVQNSGTQMLNLVMNILDVNKYEQTAMQLDLKSISIEDVVNLAVDNISFLVQQKNISIIKQINSSYTLLVDAEIVKRIFVNIFTNAIKFSPQNGEITIKTTELGSDYIQISVKDNGEGIPKEHISTIFDQYKQVSAKKSGNVKSTGIGLTFCKIAVEAHNGIINIESDTGKGFEIIFTLPRSSKIILSSKNEKAIPSSNKLTSKEEKIILNVINILKEINIYEASKILKVLKNVDYENSENIETWISKTKQAVFNANDELYQKMLNI